MALKHGGHGHNLAGIDASQMSNGELMVECLACPHLGWNLTDGWKKAGPLLWVLFFWNFLDDTNTWIRFLYALFIAIDSNFKLKGKQQYLKDVELMLG